MIRNVQALFQALNNEVSFCKKCEIVLLSCSTGRKIDSFVQKIANATKCKVYAPKRLCYPEPYNKDPLLSPVEINGVKTSEKNNFRKYIPRN